MKAAPLPYRRRGQAPRIFLKEKPRVGVCGVRLRPGICPVYVRDGQDRCKLKVVLLRVEGAVVNKTVFIFARTHQCAIWPFCLQRFRLIFFEMALSG